MSPRPRLAAYLSADGPGWGLVAGDGEAIVPLSPRFPEFPTLGAVIAAGALARVAEAGAGRAPELGPGDFAWTIPLPAPEKILCVGINYPGRHGEYRDGSEAPAHPSLFVRFPRSFTGHGAPLIRPRVSAELDYEGEVAAVIGRGGRHIPEPAALGHVAALTLANDGTLRDWVRHGKFNVTQGKNFDRSGALGPWLVPYEETAQIADIRLVTRVNGEVRQDDRTGRMLFSLARLIAYISTFTTLAPGDLILTGTPAGAGARLSPPRFLAPGDVVEVEAEGIGRLVNWVADEAAG